MPGQVSLEKPLHGWSAFHMGNWSGRLSYVDDPAFDLLWAMERAARTRRPSSVKFDAEGYEFIIVFDLAEQYVITDDADANSRLDVIDVPLRDIAPGIIRDIKADLDLWAAFPAGIEDSAAQIEERKINLGILLSVVAERL